MSKLGRWQALVDFVDAHECSWSRNPDVTGDQWGIHQLDPTPHNRLLGPVFPRGGPSGLVMRDGERLCQWGDTTKADMTFSVTKTYLVLIAGIAWDTGLIPDLDSAIVDQLPGIGFDTEHNCQISWRQMMQFTSEWSGECFGVPDQVDHFRMVSMQPPGHETAKGTLREMCRPGTYWEYNDIRMNQFSLALLHLFQRPLPSVFDTYIMHPLGASQSWRWPGYENSWVQIAGQSVQSVPGGGHWGGGCVISAADQALVSQLMINQGRVGNEQVVSDDWINIMRTPCDIAPFYGLYTWLNTNHAISTVASESSYFAMGIGGQLLWHDPDRKLVAVFRWLAEGCTEDLLSLVLEILDED